MWQNPKQFHIVCLECDLKVAIMHGTATSRLSIRLREFHAQIPHQIKHCEALKGISPAVALINAAI